ncbi:TetR/AcrR family transcriptional regulator [Demequina gelatinilytica]|uniref:TetR/AcrR family transcriptional regulator n=1 Tax=Demequina gelatinilytica TaxID=1638980 RepID=UPI0007803254|nr:TetR/AcrR family transcriptional regulator [Demequina gelatinilytica]
MTATRRSPGRPPNPELDAALIEAAANLLAEVGYDALSLAEVARRAGTTMPALYRRYKNKNSLVLAAIERDVEANSVRFAPHGSLRDDLIGLLEAASGHMTEDRLRVLAALVLARDTEPELVQRLVGGVLVDNLPALTEIVLSARVRGDGTTASDGLDMIAMLVPAIVVTHGLVNGSGPDRALVIRAVDEILMPLLAAHARGSDHAAPADRPAP